MYIRLLTRLKASSLSLCQLRGAFDNWGLRGYFCIAVISLSCLWILPTLDNIISRCDKMSNVHIIDITRHHSLFDVMLFVKFISGVTLSLDSELFSVTLSLHCSSLPPPPSDHASAFLKILFCLFMLLINSLLGKFDPFELFEAISFLLCKSALLVVKVLNQLYKDDKTLLHLRN